MRNANVSVVDEAALGPQPVVESARKYVVSFAANVAADIDAEARIDRRSPEDFIRLLVESELYGHARHSANLPCPEIKKKPKRAVLKASERAAIFQRDGGICQLCHSVIDAAGRWHVDHVKRVREGGDNGPENLRLTCEACNLERA